MLENVNGGLTRVMRDILMGAFFNLTADWSKGIDLRDIGTLVVDAICLLADMPAVAHY